MHNIFIKMYLIFLIFYTTLSHISASRFNTTIINPEGCGKRLYELEGTDEPLLKIVNGKESAIGDWGWMISIHALGGHICGGTLINNQWILTAGHCVNKFPISSYTIFIGHHNNVQQEEWSEKRKIIKKIIHENYIPYKFHNDIALLKLESPVEYSKYIVPACLPQYKVDYSGDTGLATGWGLLSSVIDGLKSVFLMEVKLPIWNAQKCILSHPIVDFGLELCAGGDGFDVCTSDSGGPLHIKAPKEVVNSKRGEWDVIGIVNYGDSKCLDGGVYGRTYAYIDWIKDKIAIN